MNPINTLIAMTLMRYSPNMLKWVYGVAKTNKARIAMMSLALVFLHLAADPVLMLVEYAQASDTSVNGYTRSNGSYVAPYYKSAPNKGYSDNYSSKGNSNPYTGSAGKKSYDSYSKKRVR